MREKVEFDGGTVLDRYKTEESERSKTRFDKNAFNQWLLINHQPMGEGHSKNLAYYINKVLVEEKKASLTVDDAKSIASKLILS